MTDYNTVVLRRCFSHTRVYNMYYFDENVYLTFARMKMNDNLKFVVR